MVEIRLISWFDRHWYKVRLDDETTDYYPSVTSKLQALAKPALYEWYGRLGTREARRQINEAADRGTRIHHAWHVMSGGGAVIFSPFDNPVYSPEQTQEILSRYGEIAFVNDQDEAYQVWKLQEFVKILQPTILASEQIIYSESIREAGTADNLLEIKGGVYPINSDPLKLSKGKYVFDLKNTSAVYDEARMQIARYAYIYELMGVKDIVGGLIGWTGSKSKKGIPGFELVHLDRDDLKYWNRSYMHVNEIWRRHYSNAKPKLIELPSLMAMENKFDETDSKI